MQKARKKANAKEKTLVKFTAGKEKGKGKRKTLAKFTKSDDEKKKPKEWPVNFLRQIETFEWLHVCSGPRISRLYDSHLDEL